jgi:hypothetical protein
MYWNRKLFRSTPKSLVGNISLHITVSFKPIAGPAQHSETLVLFFKRTPRKRLLHTMADAIVMDVALLSIYLHYRFE